MSDPLRTVPESGQVDLEAFAGGQGSGITNDMLSIGEWGAVMQDVSRQEVVRLAAGVQGGEPADNDAAWHGGSVAG